MQSKIKAAMKYASGKEVPFTQALIKHYIIPDYLVKNVLQDNSRILDAGCGEGILTNYIASNFHASEILGIDLNDEKIRIAKVNSRPNSEFKSGDLFSEPEKSNWDYIILNDVVHHFRHESQRRLLYHLCRMLKQGGKLILKEVDQTDRKDRIMTTFFDSHLYPNDELSYRSAAEWRSLLSRIGLRDIKIKRIGTLWPASRTVITGVLKEYSDLDSTDYKIDKIIDVTRASSDDKYNILLTGATGFIGSYLAEKLLKDGFRGRDINLLLLVRDKSRLPEHLLTKSSVMILEGDLSDLPYMSRSLKYIHYVFHLAAEVKFFKGIDVWRNNYAGTVSLLNALKGSACKRFVHASTIGALDRQKKDKCEHSLTENSLPNPSSEYGKSKLKAEEAVANSGFSYTIVRIPWSYGSNMTPDTHVRKLMQYVNDGKISTWFNFPGKVSVITAEDLARAFVFLAENERSENEIYFVTDGEPISIGELFKLMGETLNKKAAFLKVPGIVTATGKKLRPLLPLAIQNLNSDVLTASNDKLSELGFAVYLSKKEGLKILADSMGLTGRGGTAEGIVIITGAASGIGLELARLFRKRNYKVLMIDKNSEALGKTANDLDAQFISADLTNTEQLSQISERIKNEKMRIRCLINNAGIGLRGEFTELDIQKQMRIVELNCIAPLILTKAVLSRLKESEKLTLINIVSSAAFQPMPYMSVYSASKAFLLNYSESLTGELSANKNIEVITVLPSGTNTAFQKTAGVKKRENEKLLEPAEVAAGIFALLGKGSRTVTIGTSGKLMKFASAILPSRIKISLWARLMTDLR